MYGDPSSFEELAARVADLESALDPQTLRNSLEYTTNPRGLKDTYRLLVPSGQASPWVPLVFANTYTDYNIAAFGQCACAKDSVGQVFLKGLVTRGTGLPVPGEQIFTLPVGYRPLFSWIFHAPLGENGITTPARIDVGASGSVNFVGTGTAPVEQDYMSLAPIRFWTVG